MIRTGNEKFAESKANLIICPIINGNEKTLKLFDDYRHVEKEYLKYCKYLDKHNISKNGLAQYIPVDTWALIMVDTIKNNNINAYDTEYQYIVNLFIDGNISNNIERLEESLVDIRNKALELSATVTIPNRFNCLNGEEWNMVYKIIKDVFGKSDVQVKILNT